MTKSSSQCILCIWNSLKLIQTFVKQFFSYAILHNMNSLSFSDNSLTFSDHREFNLEPECKVYCWMVGYPKQLKSIHKKHQSFFSLLGTKSGQSLGRVIPPSTNMRLIASKVRQIGLSFSLLSLLHALIFTFIKFFPVLNQQPKLNFVVLFLLFASGDQLAIRNIEPRQDLLMFCTGNEHTGQVLCFILQTAVQGPFLLYIDFTLVSIQKPSPRIPFSF